MYYWLLADNGFFYRWLAKNDCMAYDKYLI